MEEIKAYKCKDGMIFTEKKTALQHEKTQETMDKLYNFVEKCFWSSMTITEIRDEILEHKEELMEILGESNG